MASLPEKITSTINSLCSFRELTSLSEASRETLAENLGSKSINEKKHFSNDFDTDKRIFENRTFNISKSTWKSLCFIFFFLCYLQEPTESAYHLCFCLREGTGQVSSRLQIKSKGFTLTGSEIIS